MTFSKVAKLVIDINRIFYDNAWPCGFFGATCTKLHNVVYQTQNYLIGIIVKLRKKRKKISDPDAGMVELAKKLYYQNEEKISIPYLQYKLRLSYDMAEQVLDRVLFPDEFQ